MHTVSLIPFCHLSNPLRCRLGYLLGVSVCPGDAVGDVGSPMQSGSPFLFSRIISFGESGAARLSDGVRAAGSE